MSTIDEPTIDEPTIDEPTTEASTAGGLRPWAFVVGGAIVALGVSGLLDDSGALPHPAWVVPAGAIVAICTFVIAVTGNKLTR